MLSDREDPGAVRGKRQTGGGSFGFEPERVLSAAGKVQTVNGNSEFESVAFTLWLCPQAAESWLRPQKLQYVQELPENAGSEFR